jgi:hypothetical protein
MDAFKALKSLIESDTTLGEDVSVLYLSTPCVCKGHSSGRDDREHPL